MKRTFLFFYLFCKRMLKKCTFVLLLLSIPVLAVYLKKAFTMDSVHIKAALYTPDSDGISFEAVQMLTAEDDIITFIPYNSPEEVRSAVAGGDCQCGYVLPDSLEEKLDLNVYRKSIKVFTGTYSLSPLTDEMVFSAVFKYYALHVLDKYIDDTGLFQNLSSGQIQNELSELYHQYLIDGSTFSFNYHNDEAISKDSSVLLPGYLILSVRGLLALVIFVSGFAGALQLYKDCKKGIFRTLKGTARIIPGFFVILAPVFLTGISCLIGLAVSGSIHNMLKELACMGFYMIAVSLYCYALCVLFKNQVTLCSFIPIIIMAALIICPVFIDITEFNGNLRILQQIFPVTWYLELVN